MPAKPTATPMIRVFRVRSGTPETEQPFALAENNEDLAGFRTDVAVVRLLGPDRDASKRLPSF